MSDIHSVSLKRHGFHLSIIQGIMLGFFLLLLISLVVTAVQLSGLNQLSRYFSTFQSTSDSTNMMLKIDKDVSELQRYILAFSNTEKVTTTTQIKQFHQQLLDDINFLIGHDSATTSIRADLLQQMKKNVEGLSEKIDMLKEQRDFRETMITSDLARVYTNIDMTIDDIFFTLDKKNEKELMNQLWLGQQYIDNLQSSSNRYFSKHEFQIKKDTLVYFNLAENTFKLMLASINDHDSHARVNKVIEGLNNAKIVFNQAVQADRNYLFLINVVLAGESAEISTLSNNLRIDFLNQQHQLAQTTEKQISTVSMIAIASAILGSVLAIAIALLTGHQIRKPLYSITDTFSRLAKGENLPEIPGADRLDEIGKLAKAANVFRQTNVRTQELLSKTEEFAHALKQRSEELEMAATKAEAANVSKSQFLANMSHELRTPMNAILGMLSLLQKTELNTRQQDYVVKTEGAARSLLSLLNDILDLSKAEAGKMELYPVAFCIDDLLRDLSVILSTNLTKKPVELLIEVPDDMPRYFLGDSLRLQQILINLGGNAIKFTERGQVIISITQESISALGVTLKFSVKDSGIGIAAENLQKIFSGFTQAEASTTRRFGGTGLGLAISQRLVTLMGGHLDLESQIGVGSQFFFSIELPLLADEKITELKSVSLTAKRNSDQKRLSGINILLVEDNLTNQQIALELLAYEGASVQVANNGQEAIDFLSHHLESNNKPGVDLVLMDLQMPVMDGLTATEKIRKELQLNDLPIIAMTANAMKSDRDTCLKAGMNEHVGKPFDLHHVVNVLRAQLGWVDAEPANKEQIEPSQSQSSDATPLHNHIEWTTAVARMGGSKDLYVKMLPKFLANLSKLPADLVSLLAKGDIPTLTRELHSLKGVSATMGAMQLSQEIAFFEKSLKENPQHPDVNHMINTACTLIENNLQSFQLLMQTLNADA